MKAYNCRGRPGASVVRAALKWLAWTMRGQPPSKLARLPYLTERRVENWAIEFGALCGTCRRDSASDGCPECEDRPTLRVIYVAQKLDVAS